MNSKMTGLVTSAIISGLVMAQSVRAEESKDSHKEAPVAEKNGCKGEMSEKNGCKGEAAKKKKQEHKKSEKNSCSGKNGCAGKKETTEEKK